MGHQQLFTYRPLPDEELAIFASKSVAAEVQASHSNGQIQVGWGGGFETPYDQRTRCLVMVQKREQQVVYRPLAGCTPLWSDVVPYYWFASHVERPMMIAAYRWAMNVWGPRRGFPGRKLLDQASRLDALDLDPNGARTARLEFLNSQGRHFRTQYGSELIATSSKTAVDTIGLVRSWRAQQGAPEQWLAHEVNKSWQQILAAQMQAPHAELSQLEIAEVIEGGIKAVVERSFMNCVEIPVTGWKSMRFLPRWLTEQGWRPQHTTIAA